MNSDDLRPLLKKLRSNLNILQEREAKYGGEAPLALLNQIEDHQTALSLVQAAMLMDISLEELEEGLKPLILELDRAATPPKLEIPPPPEPTRPPELDRFVGRKAEQRYFANQLTNHNLAVISGLAGVGKTALAATLTEIWQLWMSMTTTANPLDMMHTEQVKKNRDSVLWHTFHEDEGVMTLIWKLAGFLDWNGQNELWHMLQSTQIHDSQPQPLNLLFDHLFKLLIGSGYLLCLDDIHLIHADPLLVQFIDRLGELLKAGEVSLIITSRQIPDYIRSVTFKTLTGLSVADIGHLVSSRNLDLSDELIDELYTYTEGNAELLLLSINVLKQASDPARVLKRLAEADDIERYLIKEVDEVLTDDDRKVLEATAVLLGYPASPGLLGYPVSRDAIETVAERRRLKRIILALSDQHLLTVHEEAEGEAYGQHAILQAFYYDMPNPRELRVMHRRAAEFYKEEEFNPWLAARHYERAGDYEQAARLATTDVWRLINQGQAQPLRHLLERLVEEKLPVDIQINLHLAHGQVCTFVSDNSTARISFKTALDRLKQQPATSETRLLQAQTYQRLGESWRYESPPEALTWLQQGLAVIAESDRPEVTLQREEAALRITSGDMHYAMGDHKAALEFLKQGLALLPEGPHHLRIVVNHHLGNIYDEQGELQQAHAAWQQALELAQQFEDIRLILEISTDIGIGHATAGNWAEAAKNYEQALKLAQQLGNLAEQARIENSLGWLKTNQGDYEAASQYLTHSLELTRRQNLKNSLPYVLASLGVLQVRQQDWAALEETLPEAEEVALEIEARYPLAEIYYSWAQGKLGQAQLPSAEVYAAKALTIARDLELDFEIGVALGVQGQVKLALGQTEQALSLFAQSVDQLKNRDPYQAARTKTTWGQYLISGPDMSQGHQLLQEAQATYQKLGAGQDLAEVQKILMER